MARTTLDIDARLLQALKRLQGREKRPLGQVVSELLTQALGLRRPEQDEVPFVWKSQRMGPKVDLSDKEAVYRALDGPDQP